MSKSGVEIEGLYVPPALGVISSNTAKHGNPMGLPTKDCESWASGLNIPRKGKTILYTGCEYQMTAYITSMVDVLKVAKFQDGFFYAFTGMQAITGKIGVGLTKMYGQVVGADTQKYQGIVKMAARLLQKFNVEFAYMEGELYSGALLYEYGHFEALEQHARKVVHQFKQAGVETIIALTPHSAEIFKNIYPQFVNNFEFSVIPYVSVLADAVSRSGREYSLPKPVSITLHDPCHLARSLKIVEEPRTIINSINNLEFKETALNREKTVCCGAPCEMVYPELSELIASRRVRELSETGAALAVTMCPFCHANLSKAAAASDTNIKVVDLIEILYSALEGTNVRP
jgi:dimethylglycine catabolism B